MSKNCHVCGKGPVAGNQISHSVKHTKRVWNPNLQKIRAVVNGSPRRILVCTRCLRSNKVERAI